VSVAVTGAGDNGVYREKTLEAALSKKFDASAIEGIKLSSSNMMGDIHASPEYTRRPTCVVVMAKRAVAAANG
jgi:carbon-monoxide dehydrogenase medium subunit